MGNIMQNETKVVYPNCGQEINIEEILSAKFEDKYRNEYNKNYRELKQRESDLIKREQEFNKKGRRKRSRY